MEQTMEANQVYEVYFKEITNKIDAQDYEKALALCNEVKNRLFSESFVNPILLGWQRYYTFICLVKQQKDREALEYYFAPEKHPFVYDYLQTLYMTSAAADIACSLGNPILTLKLCRLAWTASFHVDEIYVRIQKAQNACIYFERLKASHLNFSFARFLVGFGKSNKIPVLYLQGLECLLCNYRLSHSLTISAILLNSLPEVTKMLDDKNSEIEKDRILEYIEEVNTLPTSLTISNKYSEAKALLDSNKLEELKSLINEFPSLADENDEVGMTLLMSAAESGNLEAVEMLLDMGSDPHRCETVYGDSALLIASKKGYELVVRALFARGADPEVRNKFGNTPLIAAVKEKKNKVIERLVNYGVLLDRRDDDFDTALMAAIRINNLEAARMLVGAGSDITLKSREDKSIFQLADDGKDEAMIKMLAPLKTPEKTEANGKN